MPGGKRGRFVEEEQLGVAAGFHDFLLPPFERERAGDPVLMRMGARHHPCFVMQEAPVAHQGAFCGYGMEGSERVDTVLKWHGQVQGSKK